MSFDTFAQNGYVRFSGPGAAPTRFQVLGERCSGTNYVKRLLGRNTPLIPTEALGWKHGFAHARAIPPDLLVVGVVRRAAPWALSMHAKPWHCSTDMQALEFSKFLRSSWDTRVDRARYFDGARAAGQLGQPLMHDRHPISGAPFANLFALRKAKLSGLLGYAQRNCHFMLVRMEDVVAAPEAMLDGMRLPRNDTPFRPVFKRLGAKFKPAIEDRPATPDEFSAEDLAFLQASVDAKQEALLGYVYN